MRRDRRGRVYFFASQRIVKVGWSRDVSARLQALRGVDRGLFHIADMVGDRSIEQTFHWLLEPWRSHGEWFHPSEAVLTVCSLVASGQIDWVPKPWGAGAWWTQRRRDKAMELFGCAEAAKSAMKLNDYQWGAADTGMRFAVRLGVEMARSSGSLPPVFLSQPHAPPLGERDYIWLRPEHQIPVHLRLACADATWPPLSTREAFNHLINKEAQHGS